MQSLQDICAEEESFLTISSIIQTFSTNFFHSENDIKFSVRPDVRIRKEFTAMSFKERTRFIRAYRIVSTHPRHRRRFEYLVGLHTSLFSVVR